MIFPLAKTQVFPHIAFCWAWARMTLWCHAWGSKPPQIASNIHIICIQSILTSYNDVEGHMGAPLTLLDGILLRWEWISRKIWVGRSRSNVVLSWLRLQTCADCIPHPCHMYTQCFSTLICCGWAYGCTLTLLRLCRSGVEFRKIELSPSPRKWFCNVMVEAPNPLGVVHPTSMSYIHSVSAPWYAVDGHMGVPLHCYACAGQGWILGKLRYKVFQHLDTLWMGIWVRPYTVTHPTWLIFCGAVSLVESTWCDYVMVEADSHLKLIPTSILHIQSVCAHWYAVHWHTAAA
jgi:hypothetical protein